MIGTILGIILCVFLWLLCDWRNGAKLRITRKKKEKEK